MTIMASFGETIAASSLLLHPARELHYEFELDAVGKVSQRVVFV